MGTAELIFILLIREYPWVLQNLIRTRVPVGTTEQIQRYIMIFILIHYSESYHIIVGLPRPVIRNE